MIHRSLIIATGFSLFACSGTGGDGGGTIRFEGEQPLLPDFEQDTGYLPATSPVQVRALARAEGAVAVLAEGVFDDARLQPVAGSGTLDTGASFALELYANIDVSGIKYEGLVESLAYEIPAATATFDPFLLDGEATAMTTLPAKELAQIPIPSVPGGTLIVSVTGGSMTTSFAGTCATARDGMAQFVGRAVTSGAIDLDALVSIEVPVVGTKEFGPFALTVTIPAIEIAMNLGTYDAAGNLMDVAGPCVDGGGPGDGGTTGTPDAGTTDPGDSPDSGTTTDPDAGGMTSDPDAAPTYPDNCGIPPSYGDLGTLTEGYTFSTTADDVRLTVDLSQAAVAQLDIRLRPGFGGFENGLVAGLYAIFPGTDDADFVDCGNCIRITSLSEDDTIHLFQANSGLTDYTTLDESPGGRIAGTFSDVLFREVTPNGEDVPNGCTAAIDSFTFDLGVVAGD